MKVKICQINSKIPNYKYKIKYTNRKRFQSMNSKW